MRGTQLCYESPVAPSCEKKEMLSQNVSGELTSAGFTATEVQDTEATSFQCLLPVLRKYEPNFEQRKGNCMKVSSRLV